MPTVKDVTNTKIHTTKDIGSDFESDFEDNFESVSEVDREPLNGGERKHSNWRDRRETRTRTDLQPRLEDGAD